MQNSIRANEWREIKGNWTNRYFCNCLGEFMCLHYERNPNKPFRRAVHPYAVRELPVIRLRDKTGKRHRLNARRVMWELFRGLIPDGMVTVSKNGMALDLHVNNIKLISASECGRLGGGTNTIPIVKKSKTGEPLEHYRSIAQAARANYLSKDRIVAYSLGLYTPKAKAIGNYVYAREGGKTNESR